MDNTSPLWWFNHPKAIQFIEALRSLFGFGFIFELPLVMMLLAYMGVVEAEKLAGYRRYAILIIFIAAAIITPTPDLFNLFLMAVPLYLLFEIGLLGMRFYKKKLLL
jgi:sec-independent protein translocase protein TatC